MSGIQETKETSAMKHRTLIAVPGLVLVAALALPARAPAQTPAPAAKTAHGASMHSQSAVALQLAMRKLWEEHIVYTRN